MHWPSSPPATNASLRWKPGLPRWHLHGGLSPEQFDEHRLVRRVQVLHDHAGQAAVCWDLSQELLGDGEPAS
jgi:hypothetical protein